ncbi:MAG: hypothetical protein LBP91_03715, partial [Coriobacteriales bacterium]|nr:hypothetical protein [Coriobacteriales bacterium]
MGLFDAIKNRLGAPDLDEFTEDDLAYDEQEYYEAGYEEDESEAGVEPEGYNFGDTARDSVIAPRTTSAFNGYTPLVSMSDVRSQELPRLTSEVSSPQSRQQAASQIRTSLPYIGNPAEDLRSNYAGTLTSGSPGTALRSSSDTTSYRAFDTSPGNAGAFDTEEQRKTAVYAAGDSADPLLQRHSLSNPGDFSATSPAYYASRSGVGHVRPAGQARRTQRIRELAIVIPTSYAEAEIIAANLQKENA